MGIFGSSITGNAWEVKGSDVEKEYGKILAQGENIEKAYKLIRDMFIFTNKRLVLVDKQGVTGKKVDYHSIPYKSITHFSIETAGHFDLDAELKIWISSTHEPIQKQFTKSVDIYELQRVLAAYVLK